MMLKEPPQHALMTNSGEAYEQWKEDRIEELEAQVTRLQDCIGVLVDTYAWDINDAHELTTKENMEWSCLHPFDLNSV